MFTLAKREENPNGEKMPLTGGGHPTTTARHGMEIFCDALSYLSVGIIAFATSTMFGEIAKLSVAKSACDTAKRAVEQKAAALNCSFDPNTLNVFATTFAECAEIINSLSFKNCSDINATKIINDGSEIISAAEPAGATAFNTGMIVGAGLGIAVTATFFYFYGKQKPTSRCCTLPPLP